MNRRKFLNFLSLAVGGSAVAAVAPSLSTVMGPECVTTHTGCTCAGRSFWEGQCEWCARQPKSQEILGYADYTSFSAIATAAAIDDIVSNAAKELGEAAGQHISALHASAFV